MTRAPRTSIDQDLGRSRTLNERRAPQQRAASVHPLLRLQQCVGNRAVARTVQAALHAPPHIQREPETDGPKLRDVPILLEKLELDVGNNLRDYGHHLY